MVRFKMMFIAQSPNQFPGDNPAVTVSPDDQGTITERQQVRQDLIHQSVNAFRWWLGSAIFAAWCLHGQDVTVLRRIEQKLGE